MRVLRAYRGAHAAAWGGAHSGSEPSQNPGLLGDVARCYFIALARVAMGYPDVEGRQARAASLRAEAQELVDDRAVGASCVGGACATFRCVAMWSCAAVGGVMTGAAWTVAGRWSLRRSYRGGASCQVTGLRTGTI